MPMGIILIKFIEVARHAHSGQDHSLGSKGYTILVEKMSRTLAHNCCFLHIAELNTSMHSSLSSSDLRCNLPALAATS